MNRYKEISQHRKLFDVVTNWIHYPIANWLCAVLSYSFVTPNMITIAAIGSEIAAIYFIINDFYQYKIYIVILLQLGWILDLMDGMMARFKKLGYYHPTQPSNKGYYLDAISDHILKFIIIGALGYELSQTHEFGWQLGMLALIIHGITQTEHTLRGMITRNNRKPIQHVRRGITDHLALLLNNIYLFYLVFIPMNRIDLLLITFAGVELSLLVKRIISFWINEP